MLYHLVVAKSLAVCSGSLSTILFKHDGQQERRKRNGLKMAQKRLQACCQSLSFIIFWPRTDEEKLSIPPL